jgi:hypothetical protein
MIAITLSDATRGTFNASYNSGNASQHGYLGRFVTSSRIRPGSAFPVCAELRSSNARISSLIDFRPLPSASIFGITFRFAARKSSRPGRK